MNSYNDLIDSDPLERDPGEHEADADTMGMGGPGDSESDEMPEARPEGGDTEPEAPEYPRQPYNEIPRTDPPDERARQTARDDEDTNRVDEFDEVSEFDEVNWFREVDALNEIDITPEIVEEPVLRVEFDAQDLTPAEPFAEYEPPPPPEFAVDEPADEPDDGLDWLDMEPLYEAELPDLDVEAHVSLEMDDLADPLEAFRWFEGEDVFDESEWDYAMHD